MAFAKIGNISGEMIVVSFSGPFCYECGDVQKFVDDFAQDFKVFSDSAELEASRTRESIPHSVEVSYVVKPRR
jgi:hypothetical protein